MSQSEASASVSLGPFTVYDRKAGVYASRLPPPTIPAESVFEYCLGSVSLDDQGTAITECATGRTISYGQLKLRAQRFGLGLVTKAKLKRGDTVLVALHSSIDFAVCVMAAQFAGLRVALANPDYAPKELKHVYKLVRPKKVIVHSTHLSRAARANLQTFNVILTNTKLGRGGVLSIDELLAPEAEARAAKPYVPEDLNTTAYLPASSGTTGLPKAVQISHRNLVAMLAMNFNTPGFIPESLGGEQLRMLSFLPFFHAYGLVGQLHLILRQRGQLFILRPFTPQSLCAAVQQHRINLLNCVPPALTKLTKYAGTTRAAFASVKRVRCGAAPLDAETEAKFSRMTGVEVKQGWGMTELTLAGLDPSSGQQTPGSVGCLIPSTLAKVVDVESGEPVEPGQRGELLIKGDQVFSGYLANEAETKASFTADGFFRTGDVVIVDARTGEFSIVDRMKELIKYQGFQVAPAELEGLLVTQPSVAAAAVVGRYDREAATELPCAFVELSPSVSGQDAKQVVAQIDAFVRSKVSHHKFLRGGIHVVDKVPVSASGKILRKQVRQMLQQLEAAHSTPQKAKL
ncbi:phenylacetyl- protein [Moesziomyces antarcticus]|uniref:Phenylacetyl-protein n=2 Tax=Pseudozyma antarctica TaxID=84753 RepID=A0A081CLS3_PSEA2|nr:phenylacetyl- protein [Moesziomyces antarcticus]GAK67619.1 phenylacetyl- protein [Moesziomyces antarcticus]SPO48888.1 related to 4-coumarate--CoA ligase 1 [Moesziomyces antarcticus]